MFNGAKFATQEVADALASINLSNVCVVNTSSGSGQYAAASGPLGNSVTINIYHTFS